MPPFKLDHQSPSPGRGDQINIELTEDIEVMITQLSLQSIIEPVFDLSDTATALATEAGEAEGGIVSKAGSATFTTPSAISQIKIVDQLVDSLDYSAGIIDDVANLAAANGTLTTDATTYVDTTVDVEINDAATIAQIKGIDTAFGTVDYSAGIADDVANLAAANGTLTTDAITYVDTTVDVEINDAATIAQIKGIDTAFGTVDYSAGIADDAVTLAAVDGTINNDADLYDDTTVDVTINNAATIAQIKGIDTPSVPSITRWHCCCCSKPAVLMAPCH